MTRRKILHTSDWHLGQTFHGHERTWEHERFLAWLLETVVAQEIDALLVAGDVFDTANPSAVAERQWFTFLAELLRVRPGCDVVAIAGNHDSAARLDASTALTRALGIHVVGAARTSQRTFDPGRLVVPLGGRSGIEPWGHVAAIPFLRSDDLGSLAELAVEGAVERLARARHAAVFDELERRARPSTARIAMGHGVLLGSQRSRESEREVLIGNVEALPVDVFPADLGYVALGHLHRAQRVGGRDAVRYSGSPLPLHVSEAEYSHQVVRVTFEGADVVAVEPLRVPRWVPIARIPSSREPCTAEEALAALDALPDCQALPEPERPFVEVRYRADRPRPTFVADVTARVAARGHRLTTVRAVVPEVTPRRVFEEDGRTLAELDPAEVFRAAYARKFPDAEPSDALLSAFRELVDDVQREESSR